MGYSRYSKILITAAGWLLVLLFIGLAVYIMAAGKWE